MVIAVPMLMNFFVAAFSFVLNSHAQIEFNDSLMDHNNPQIVVEKMVASESYPIRWSFLMLSDENKKWLDRVRPLAVEIIGALKDEKISGVIVGYNELNQPIVLSTASGIRYFSHNLKQLPSVSLDAPYGDRSSHLNDIRSPNVITSWSGENKMTKGGWYGLPVFHPPFPIENGVVLQDLDKNYAFYVMTGTTISLPDGPLDKDYITAGRALKSGFLEPRTYVPKVAPASWGEEVLVVGHSELNFKPEVYYSISSIASKKNFNIYHQKYFRDVSPEPFFVLNGSFDAGMVGSGIFNRNGDLIGIVAKILSSQSSQGFLQNSDGYVGAIALRADFIFRQTQTFTQQNFLQKITEIRSLPLRCEALFGG